MCVTVLNPRSSRHNLGAKEFVTSEASTIIGHEVLCKHDRTFHPATGRLSQRHKTIPCSRYNRQQRDTSIAASSQTIMYCKHAVADLGYCLVTSGQAAVED